VQCIVSSTFQNALILSCRIKHDFVLFCIFTGVKDGFALEYSESRQSLAVVGCILCGDSDFKVG